MIGDERRRREIVIERSEETGPNLQAFRIRVIEVHATRCSRIAFAEKVLDRIDGPVLYKQGCAMTELRTIRKNIQC